MSNIQTSSAEIDLKRYFLRASLFDHPTEFEFYKILRDVILGKRFVALVEFPLSSLIDVKRKSERWWKAHFAKIARKRIDYLICRKEDLKPLLVIELDGSSHLGVERRERDQFLDDLYSSVGIPVVHVPVQRQYNLAPIALEIAQKMKLEESLIKELTKLAQTVT